MALIFKAQLVAAAAAAFSDKKSWNWKSFNFKKEEKFLDSQ